MTNLTLTHLRFTATVTSDIEPGRHYAGILVEKTIRATYNIIIICTSGLRRFSC